MVKITSALAISASLALAACASSGTSERGMSEEAKAKLAQFDKSGTAEACLPLISIDKIKALDEYTFLVRTKSNQFYLNEVSGRCSKADRSGYALTYETSGSQLCNNQIIRVLDTTSRNAFSSCSLGKFQPLEKKSEG